jgi:hypothetical protein
MSVRRIAGWMRYATVVVYPSPAALHPIEQRLAEAGDLHREAIHAFEQLGDGSIALLTEVSGNLDRYREIVSSSPAVRQFAVSGDDRGYCYSHVEPTPVTSKLIEQKESSELVVKLPIEYTDDGGQRVTLVGREEDLVGSPVDVPDSFDVELVSTGPYRPEVEDVFADLTSRQRDVLDAAVRLGYYENPRQATHEDVAAEVGVEAGTVGKHLRSIESRVFSADVL